MKLHYLEVTRRGNEAQASCMGKFSDGEVVGEKGRGRKQDREDGEGESCYISPQISLSFWPMEQTFE